MKCVVHKSVCRPILVWSSTLLLFLLAACGGNSAPNINQEGVQIDIFASLGRSSSTTDEQAISSQGVPVDPETGETGVDRAELEVYNGETRLFFREGRLVDEAESERVTLTPNDSEVSLFLPEGSYRFALSAFDTEDNVLAKGQVEQQVGADSRVSIPLTSLLGSASFRVPESVKANEVFDAFLEVSPPNRPDLRVPLGDFTVSYEVAEPSMALEGSSNVGVRVAAACDVVEVTVTVDNDLSDAVNASASIPVNDEVCEEANDTPVGTDLIPPFVSIKTPEANSTVGKDFTLQGDVNDQQSGVDKVEVYEGTLKLGEADIDSNNMMWSFDTSLEEGSYTLIAVAFDKAGNTSREEVSVTVEEGAGGGDDGDNPQVCTSPVNVPDENLRRTLENTLGLGEGDPITCAALAGLTEFFQGGTDENDNLVEISTLEGLQFATNLEVIDIRDAIVDDISAIFDLPKLQKLSITSLEACSGEAFQAEIERLKERGVEVEIALVGSCSDTTCTNPVNIPNEALEATIRAELRLAEDTEITCENLANLSELSYGAEENFSEDNTELLEGLQYAVNLMRLDLRLRVDPLTSDVFAPLENLTILETINLSIPIDTEDEGVLSFLDDFTTLRALSVEPALVDDPEGVLGPTLDLSPLQGLTNLTNLRLAYVDFTDLSPLQNLTNLTDLSIEVNREIGDISALQNLSALNKLQLDGISVSNIDALQSLSNLTSLDLLLEELSDIDALRNLSNLMNLFLAAPVDDIRPLQNLSNLSDLTLLVPVSDISPLQNLSSLTRLSFGGEAFSDVSPLQNLTNLTSLDLSFNEVSDITPLQNLSNLTEINLRGNDISDISVLQNLTGLTGLFLDNNPLGSDIGVLRNLTKLVSLDLASTGLSDISVLEDLTNLTFLELSFNEISDISALVANEGLGLSDTNEGDQVFLRDNPLSPQALEDVETLEARFVVVTL